MSNNRSKNPSIIAILVHLALTVITGGLWLIVLLIWFMLKK